MLGRTRAHALLRLPRRSPAPARHLRSDTRAQVTQDLLATLQSSVSGGVSLNPATASSPPPTEHGPPRAGPEGYNSAKDNPMGQAHIDKALRDPGKSYRLDCRSTRNNTIITVSSLEYSNNYPAEPAKSNPLAWYSGGTVGFKKGNRSGYEAGYQCAVRAFKLLEGLKRDNRVGTSVHLYFSGFGQGREALKTALTTSEGDQVRDLIRTITDRTALKIGGTRSKKTRRL